MSELINHESQRWERAVEVEENEWPTNFPLLNVQLLMRIVLRSTTIWWS